MFMESIYCEQYLLDNPQLCSDSKFMFNAVSYDPKLIRYSGEKCYYDPDFLNVVFSKYKITLDDLYFNPKLCSNRFIMKFFPEYRMYCTYLSFDEKVEFLSDYLKNGYDIKTLPFFDSRFNHECDINRVVDFVDFFNSYIDQNDINNQEFYFHILDRLIDAVLNIRYSNGKKNFMFNSVVSLNNYLLNCFDSYFISGNYSYISNFINDVYVFLNYSLSFDYINDIVLKFYDFFMKNGFIDLSITGSFFNEVLNLHRNYFMSSNKDLVYKKICGSFDLSEKRKKSILVSKKLSIISSLISSRRFSDLGIDEKLYSSFIDGVIFSIKQNSDIKKIGFDDSFFEGLIDIFNSNGFLDDSNFDGLCSDQNVIDFICRKFNNLRLKFLNNVSFSDLNFNYYKSKYPFNYSNYLIYSNDVFYRNLSKIILGISDYSNINLCDDMHYMLYLVPFVDLFDEFKVESFIDMLSVYDTVKSKLDVSNVFDRLGEFISLSSVYCSIDSLDMMVLGNDILSKVGKESAHAYSDFYLKMLNRGYSYIPSISFDDGSYSYESGVFADINRLLIGHSLKAKSCINIGTDSFNELLLEPTGDVILVRDKSNVISRILLFRRGNLIQIVSNVNTKFPLSVYQEICNQIVSKSSIIGDNIDFVFVNCSSISSDISGLNVVKDSRFITNFPHADFFNYAVCLYSKENSVISFDDSFLGIYPKVRLGVIENPSSEYITRLRALDVLLENDFYKRELKKDLFQPYVSFNYIYSICGEDWYICVDKELNVEKLVLPICSCSRELVYGESKVKYYKK